MCILTVRKIRLCIVCSTQLHANRKPIVTSIYTPSILAIILLVTKTNSKVTIESLHNISLFSVKKKIVERILNKELIH